MKLIQITAAAFSLSATVASPEAAHSLRHRMLQTQFTQEQLCIADMTTLLKKFNVERHSFMKKCPKSETLVGNTPFIDYRPCHPSFVNHLTDVCTAAGGFIVYHFEHLWNECQNTNTGEWTMVGTNGYYYECFANSCYALTWQPNFYYNFIHMMQSSGYHMHVYDCDTNIIPETPSTPPVITEENSDDGPIPPGEAVTEGPSIPPGETVTGWQLGEEGTGTEKDFTIVITAGSLVAVLAGICICTCYCYKFTICENHNIIFMGSRRELKEEQTGS